MQLGREANDVTIARRELELPAPPIDRPGDDGHVNPETIAGHTRNDLDVSRDDVPVRRTW